MSDPGAGPPGNVTAETAYLFRHALLRDAAYELQPPTERARLHVQAIGVMIDQHDGKPPDSLAAELAEHAGLALALGLRTPQVRDHRQKFLQAAIAHAIAGFRLAETIGLASALADLPWAAPEVRIDALLNAAEHSDRAGHRDDADRFVSRALRRLAGRDLPRHAHRAHSLRSVIRIHQGRYRAAEHSLQQVVDRGPAFPGDGRHVVALGNLAIVHRESGRVALAEREYRQAIDFMRQSGNAVGCGRNLGNLANLLKDRGEWPQAEAAYREGLQLVQQAGERFLQGIIQTNLGELLLLRGQPQAAAEMLHQARTSQQQLGDLEGAAETDSHLAAVEAAQGRLAPAIALAQSAIETLQKLGSRLLAAQARVRLSRHLLQTGKPQQALGEATLADTELGAIGAREVRVRMSLPALIRATLANGGDARPLAQRLRAARKSLKRLGHGADSPTARELADCAAMLRKVNPAQHRPG